MYRNRLQLFSVPNHVRTIASVPELYCLIMYCYCIEFCVFRKVFLIFILGDFTQFVSFRSPSLFYLPVHSRCRGFLFSLYRTQTHTIGGRTPLDEGSARRRDLYLKTQTLHKRQTSMPPVGFEPTIPASTRPQTRPRGYWDRLRSLFLTIFR
jgi:hypothetical protein